MSGKMTKSKGKTGNQKKSGSSKQDEQTALLKVGKGVWSSVRIVHQPTLHTEHFAWTRRSLYAAYSKFPKLLGERKFAKSPTKASTVIFLDLPADIRNDIYTQLLHFQYIELAGKSANKPNSVARNHHMRHYKYEVRSALKLLRTCKQINQEASSIFYGENEFRFTAIYGCDILWSFCRTIGRLNTSFLTTITLHIPFAGYSNSGYEEAGARASGNCWSNFQDLVRRRMGLHENRVGSTREHVGGEFHIPRLLSRTSKEKLVGLQKLRLVMPHTYIIRDFEVFDPEDRNYSNGFMLYDHLSKKKLAELKIELVMLDNHDRDEENQHAPDPQTLRGRAAVVQYAKTNAWKIVDTTYDDKGRYVYYKDTVPTEQSIEEGSEKPEEQNDEDGAGKTEVQDEDGL